MLSHTFLLLSVLSFILLSFVSHTLSWNAEHPYGDLGIELQCTKKIYVAKDQIIDIQKSVQYGAELLNGMYTHSFDVCVESCCQYNGCDLVVFKTDGVSQTGKTCYYVHCGLPEHCRMVNYTGFLAGFLIEPDYGEALDNHQEDHNSQFQDSQGQTPPSVATKPPAETEPTTPVSPAVSNTEATPSVATEPPAETEPTTPVSPAVSDTEATPSETAQYSGSGSSLC